MQLVRRILLVTVYSQFLHVSAAGFRIAQSIWSKTEYIYGPLWQERVATLQAILAGADVFLTTVGCTADGLQVDADAIVDDEKDLSQREQSNDQTMEQWRGLVSQSHEIHEASASCLRHPRMARGNTRL